MYQILPMNSLSAVLPLSLSLIAITAMTQFWIESKLKLSSKKEEMKIQKMNKSMFSLFVS
nr:ATP synthase F0 subunit 8 [Scirtothrips hansoni]